MQMIYEARAEGPSREVHALIFLREEKEKWRE
jgi:hypothetical protein